MPLQLQSGYQILPVFSFLNKHLQYVRLWTLFVLITFSGNKLVLLTSFKMEWLSAGLPVWPDLTLSFYTVVLDGDSSHCQPAGPHPAPPQGFLHTVPCSAGSPYPALIFPAAEAYLSPLRSSGHWWGRRELRALSPFKGLSFHGHPFLTFLWLAY